MNTHIYPAGSNFQAQSLFWRQNLVAGCVCFCVVCVCGRKYRFVGNGRETCTIAYMKIALWSELQKSHNAPRCHASIYLVAIRGSGRGQGLQFQIFCAYSSIVRSVEKKPMPDKAMRHFWFHVFGLLYSLSTRSWHSR